MATCVIVPVLDIHRKAAFQVKIALTFLILLVLSSPNTDAMVLLWEIAD